MIDLLRKATGGVVRYFPTNLELAGEADGADAYYRGVTDLLPRQVQHDFPYVTTAQRGTIVSLRDEFPHYRPRLGRESTDGGLPVLKYGDPTIPMKNVLSVVRTGSDRDGEIGNVGSIGSDGHLHHKTEEYLTIHLAEAIEDLLCREKFAEADGVFPALLVYDSDRLPTAHRLDADGGLDPDVLLAVIITDRVLGPGWDFGPSPTQKGLGGAALGGS